MVREIRHSRKLLAYSSCLNIWKLLLSLRMNVQMTEVDPVGMLIGNKSDIEQERVVKKKEGKEVRKHVMTQ